VLHCTSPNDANHRNRHAEANGVEFFAFPYQSLYARVDWKSAIVSDSFLMTEGDGEKRKLITRFSASRLDVFPDGSSKCIDQKHFKTHDEAIIWASEWLIKL
jgi:hypothetical protein